MFYVRAISVFLISLLAGYLFTLINRYDLNRYSKLTEPEIVSELKKTLVVNYSENLLYSFITILIFVVIYEFLVKIINDVISKVKQIRQNTE